MRIILLTILLIIQTICFGLNAKTFGAKGDGIQDDAPYLNAAIAKALLLGEDLYIPAGTYKCTALDAQSKILKMDQSGIKKITIYGEDGTKITTEQATGCLFFICYKNTDVIIKNIFFENTHGITLDQTRAIQLLGTNENSIQNFTIENCKFEGFSTAILAQGVKGLKIQNNVFESPKGHDNAQNNSQPAVFIWLADNTNGQCFNVTISNNSVNGFTGNDIKKTVTKRPMDGFVFGIAYGIIIQGNQLRNLGEEYIFLQPAATFINSNDSVLITKNNFHLSIPSGSMKDGAPLVSNYAVRSDCNNVRIQSNYFYDYTIGILVYPYEHPTLKLHNYTISENRFFSPANHAVHVQEAIKIQSHPSSPSYDMTITNNIISIDSIQLKSSRSAISVYDCNNVKLVNNTISGQNINTNGHALKGILTERCFKVMNKSNTIRIK